MIIKKLLPLLIIVAMLISFATGCTQQTTVTTTTKGQSSSNSTSNAPSNSTATTGTTKKAEKIELRYSLWDMNQAPAYRAIIDNFMLLHPNVKVTVELTPYADYFTKITTQAAGGNCPDVMTMMPTMLKSYASTGILMPIDNYIAKDKFDLSNYNNNSLEIFQTGGARYAIPKDFDACALFYNKDLLKAAGYDSFPTNLSWNPQTGGTFVEFLQKLTVDKNGKRANEAGFDPKAIAQYGGNLTARTFYNLDNIFSAFTAANGGRMFNPDTGALTLDEPKTLDSIKFLCGLVNKWHVIPGINTVTATGPEALFYAGKVAVWYNGPWMANTIKSSASFKWGIALIPNGPLGKSYTRANSIADCIYSKSKNPEMAWELAKYIVTEAGQNLLGNTGTVIPAYSKSVDRYINYFDTKGIPGIDIFIKAYNGDVVTAPRYYEYAKADDMAKAFFSEYASEGKSLDNIENAVKTLVSEANKILIPANTKK